MGKAAARDVQPSAWQLQFVDRGVVIVGVHAQSVAHPRCAGLHSMPCISTSPPLAMSSLLGLKRAAHSVEGCVCSDKARTVAMEISPKW